MITLSNIDDLKKKLKEDLKNPEETLKKMGIDVSKIDQEALKAESEKLKRTVEDFGEAYSLENFRNTSSLYNNLNQKGESIENISKKLTNVFAPEFKRQLKENGKDCFCVDHAACEGEIIEAHSVQERNNKLKAISRDHEVYHIASDLATGKKSMNLIPTSKAGVFKGFCKKHDNQIFQPIDDNPFNSSVEHCFLYSLRAFSYSYHQKREYQSLLNPFDSQLEVLSGLLGSLSGILGSLGMNTDLPIPSTESIKITPEQTKEIEEQRFERHRRFLLNYYDTKHFDQLAYFVYKMDHVSPIVASSWITLHAEMRGAYLIIDPTKIYRGYPCTISVFPERDNCSYVIISRFKYDTGSEFIFKQLLELKGKSIQAFELLLTKLIFSEIDNFHFSPAFIDSLTEDERNQLLQDIIVPKAKFPEHNDFTPSLNIFDPQFAVR